MRKSGIFNAKPYIDKFREHHIFIIYLVRFLHIQFKIEKPLYIFVNVLSKGYHSSFYVTKFVNFHWNKTGCSF